MADDPSTSAISSAVTSKTKSSTKKAAAPKVQFWSAECKYPVIMDRVKSIGWKANDQEKKERGCNLFWVDVATIQERFRVVQPWQMVNHVPGMTNIARKNRMGANLNRMAKLFPIEYSFYPKTYVLPQDLAEFRAQFDANGNSIGNKYYIVKPDSGCQGKGIFITRTFSDVPLQDVVAQYYIKRPLLIDNFKFDFVGFTYSSVHIRTSPS